MSLREKAKHLTKHSSMVSSKTETVSKPMVGDCDIKAFRKLLTMQIILLLAEHIILYVIFFSVRFLYISL